MMFKGLRSSTQSKAVGYFSISRLPFHVFSSRNATVTNNAYLLSFSCALPVLTKYSLRYINDHNFQIVEAIRVKPYRIVAYLTLFPTVPHTWLSSR